MKKHIEKHHPTVCVSSLEEEGEVYRHEGEPIQPVPVSFPSPPGFSPYRPQEVEIPFEYVPTPKSAAKSDVMDPLSTPEWKVEVLDDVENTFQPSKVQSDVEP